MEEKTIQQKYDEYKEYIKHNPVKWIEEMCGTKLYWYQKLFLKMYWESQKLRLR
jgi:hypothetical protein